MPPIHVKISYR